MAALEDPDPVLIFETAAFFDVLGWASAEGSEPIEVVTAGLESEVTCTFVAEMPTLLTRSASRWTPSSPRSATIRARLSMGRPASTKAPRKMSPLSPATGSRYAIRMSLS